jgi:hypothetical protein
MRRLLVPVLLLAATAGCAQQIAEHRVRAALVSAGLSERNADCMAHRMVRKLTIRQLRRLEALKGEKRSIADYVIAVRRVGDARAVAVTAKSAAVCELGLARQSDFEPDGIVWQLRNHGKQKINQGHSGSA